MLLTAFSLLSIQGIITVLAWHQNPQIRTNYGKFKIRYFGPKIWKEIKEQLKTLSFRCFKRELKERFLDKYIDNNNRGRLKFVFTISLFYLYVAFLPLFFYLYFSGFCFLSLKI